MTRLHIGGYDISGLPLFPKFVGSRCDDRADSILLLKICDHAR